ncbi:YceH family protein [uncultured Thiodictyon sp.]|uniref:YceH family protein n=1 Tax=uncultured Thiodictyon sp. TaxID=1846217 RepID=UPI0025EF7387|nr:YceH family protein [uncultured Thiodictyon sp.]
MTTDLTEPLLNTIEARILGCLMEKQRTTPEQYPLTLSSLVSACNQKSSRAPVMHLEPGEVGHQVNQLRTQGLIHAGFSGRSERYDHKLVGTYHLSREEQAVLTVLMLRGPQTLGELRTNSTRLAEFPDLNAVTATVTALIDRGPPLVMELPRLPGKREERYMHLLCGMPDPTELAAMNAAAAATPAPPPGGSAADSRIAALESEVAQLRTELDRLWVLTGLADRRAEG